jgi:hypothetical protein
MALRYDPELEEREYSRALLGPEELAELKATIAREGFMAIGRVRAMAAQNTVKESMDAAGATYALEPELLMQIDVRIDYPVFIEGDTVYTREELLASYPFEDLGTAPEDVFAQQVVGVFPPRRWEDAGTYSFVARDLECEEPFEHTEDLVRRITRPEGAPQAPVQGPLRVVKTKIFLGKEAWADFKSLHQTLRTFRRYLRPLMLGAGEGGAHQGLARLLGLAVGLPATATAIAIAAPPADAIAAPPANAIAAPPANAPPPADAIAAPPSSG